MGWNGMRRGGVGRLLAVTVGGGLLLAGCGGGAPSIGGSAPVAGTGSTSAGQPASTGPTAVASPTGGQQTASPGGGPAQGGNCMAADLAVTVTPGSDNGMSHRSANVVFTNKGGRTCTLFGYPGVSFVSGPNGNQVGKAADRAPDGGGQHIALAPGRSASSPLRIAETGVYPEGDCRPVQVAGLRVYAPGDTAWTYVASPQTACSGSTDTQLVVYVVR